MLMKLAPLTVVLGRYRTGDWTYRLTDGSQWLL